ncbi:hypothetical protein D5018_18470 [Parashewanella curva]|uniref:DUF995 domain-containing protein n=1 Tax=Parashewanella curva TaxID=2338552 RepID=A0A3L8PUV8_9GAMM|nr:hypothetical protein [Parashewanella curva]RLV58208.1 hypothetical protein D5018_18470 [Parashewanella curva]
MKKWLGLLLLSASMSLTSVASAAPHNGKVREFSNGTMQMWDASSQKWLGVESFWLKYAKQNGGLTWGMTDTYPEYSKVKEFDKILIKTDKGNCLMEFFHRRWRRAQDVRRWDEKVNQFGGCPYVFD